MPELRQPLGLKALWAKVALLLSNSAGTEIRALAENDGTARSQLIGYDGTNQVRVGVEATSGTLKTMLYGQDSGSNEDPLRTNANQQLQVEVVNSAFVQVDPVVLTASNVAVYNPGTDAAEVYEVWFLIANTGAAVCTVSVGIDLGGGAALDRAYWDGYSIPAEETTGWHYLGRIAGDDDVVAANATAATVAATIFLKVNQLA